MSVKKTIEQYRKLSKPAKAAVWFTICQFFQKGISILTSPIMVRLLPIQEYGRVSVFTSWTSFFMIVVTLSSYHAVGNLCVKYNSRERILSCLIGYNMLISTIWVMLFLVGNHVIREITDLSNILILCLFIQCLFTSQINCWSYTKQFDYFYRCTVFESLFCTICTAFGTLFAVVFVSQTAEAMIIPQTLITAVIGLVIIVLSIKPGRLLYDKGIWKFTFLFCVPLLPHYLSEIILMSSDRIMIDRMCGSSDVAIYSVAYTVGSLIMLIATAVNSAFGPYQYHKIAGKEYKLLAKNTNIIIAFIAFCLCGIMLFGREIIFLFGGSKYYESISLIIPISLGVFFNYVFQLFGRVQQYFEQKHTIVIASISCALLNIILNFIFIRRYGYKAAAYTTFFCYFAFCFFHYFFYRIACKKNIGQEIYDIKGLCLISVTLILMSVIIGIISRWILIKYMIMMAVFILVVLQRKRILLFVKDIRGK